MLKLMLKGPIFLIYSSTSLSRLPQFKNIYKIEMLSKAFKSFNVCLSLVVLSSYWNQSNSSTKWPLLNINNFFNVKIEVTHKALKNKRTENSNTNEFSIFRQG